MLIAYGITSSFSKGKRKMLAAPRWHSYRMASRSTPVNDPTREILLQIAKVVEMKH